jgi:PAS domain S-box-containing protein
MALVVIGVGIIVLFGWAAHIGSLIYVLPGLVSMKANTALCFVCCGLSLFVLASFSKSNPCPASWRAFAFLLAALGVVLGILTCYEYTAHANLHLDEIFLRDFARTAQGSSYLAGRMSPITAANFVFLGSALMCLAANRPPKLTQLLAGCSGFLSLVVLTGTSYGIQALIGQVHYAAVAVHTNFCFMLLFAGILCATGEHGIMRLLTDAGSAGNLLRRLLPAALLVPLFISSITAGMEQAGWLSLELGISIFSICTIVAYAILVWWSGVFLHRSESQKRNADALLRETLGRYTFLADAMPEMVWTAKADGSVDYFNQRWIEYTGLSLEESRNWGWNITLHPDDLQRCLDRWNESIKTGDGYKIEYRLKAKDGTYRWFAGRAFPMRDERGAIVQWVGNCADIDDQKRARDELERRVIERTAEVAGARERLQAVLDSATQSAIIAVDDKGWITLFNRGAEQMFGYSAAELVGKHNPSLFHVEWEVAARAREMEEKYGRPLHGFDIFVENVRHGLPEQREWTLVRKDGSRFPASLIITAMRDGGTRITGFLGIVTDITAHKEANRRLHDQAVLLDLASESIVIRDINDLITYWNQGAERLYGWTKDEALGRITHELFHTVFPEPLVHIRTGLLEKGEWQGELVHTRRDGSLVTVASSWTLQRDETGEPLSIIEINHDVTARRSAEEELRESRERLNTILNSSFDGMIAYEAVRDGQGDLRDFRFVMVNQAAEKLMGKTASAVLGRSVLEHYPNIIADGLFEKFVRIVENGASMDFEFLSTRTNPPCWYRVAGVKLGDGLVISYADITARKLYERELQDAKVHAEMADRAKSNFLANMSHEIRTPMNGVIGLTGLLLETDLNTEQRTLSETIRSSAESLLGVINDILDFSKIEAGKLTIEQTDFDLRKVVEDALEGMASLAQNKGLELVGGVEPGTPTHLRGDPTRVRQVLTNLIGNALKFTAAGEVALKVSEQSAVGDKVVIRCEVRDTGFGIRPEVQARLFQPFAQGDASTSRQFGGTGLGLAICRRLAEAMHGQIGVTSAPGAGSTFWVTLEFSRQPQAVPEPAAPNAFTHARVLVVDDNASSREFLQRMLASWRLRNDAVANSEDALTLLNRAAAQKKPFTVALLNLRPPALDGLALAQLIYADPVLRTVRVILLTPIGKPIPSDEIAPPNIAACCMKPVRQSALFDCLVQTVAKPMAKDATQPLATRARATASLPLRKERLLLAEDNPVNQEVALGNLRKLGYHADVALNGLEVLDAMETKHYDIILMDCQMPELDGYETTRQLRQRERGGHRTRIIAMTANAMLGDREKCLAAGMDDYVSKPLHRAELRAALERQVQKPTAPFSEKVLRGIVDDDPKELAKLVDLFTASAPGNIASMREALAALNAPLLARAAHTLKGSCGSLGATTLREICLRLEQNAREGQLEGAEELIASAEEELHRFTEALTDYLHAKSPQ